MYAAWVLECYVGFSFDFFQKVHTELWRSHKTSKMPKLKAAGIIQRYLATCMTKNFGWLWYITKLSRLWLPLQLYIRTTTSKISSNECLAKARIRLIISLVLSYFSQLFIGRPIWMTWRSVCFELYERKYSPTSIFKNFHKNEIIHTLRGLNHLYIIQVASLKCHGTWDTASWSAAVIKWWLVKCYSAESKWLINLWSLEIMPLDQLVFISERSHVGLKRFIDGSWQ